MNPTGIKFVSPHVQPIVASLCITIVCLLALAAVSGAAQSSFEGGSTGTLLLNSPNPGPRSESRVTMSVAGVLLTIQAMLICGLLVERRARRRAELDSRKSLSLAADVTRRESVSALTSSIAHELAQPLSAMMHNAEALRLMIHDRGVTNEAMEEVLSDIHADGILAAQIIERHRMMLRSRELERKPVDLLVVLNNTLALVAHEMKSRAVDVTVKSSSDPCIVCGDAVLLQQVFVNLMMNAMDALQETASDRRHITIGTHAGRSEVEVTVRDTGPGLSADLVDKLFTPFVTTKPNGLGIGLAIARTIVNAHGGRISAGNHPEGGATFTVALRLNEMQRVPAPAACCASLCP
jgi:signal transduction histidine kinase